MKQIYCIIFIFTCLCLKSQSLNAQGLRATFPVQVTAFMNPPYSLKMEDYYQSSRQKISVFLLNRDLMEPTLDVKLHFSIKAGNGIRLETKDHNHYPTIRLQSGIPYSLSQNDLSTYLKPENLEMQGVLINGQFPEGMIEICIYIIEAQTNKIVSQTSCARAWITLNLPPILNLPLNKIKMPFQEPQNILFQWTPRHQGLSNVEYHFVLKEIWDVNIAPEAAFPYSQEIYSTTVRSTAIPYTAMMPPLMENKTYSWQVRALAKDGMEELSLFENNGFSEIHSFSISQSCHAPTNITHRQDRDHLIIEWEPEPNTEVNVVAYRLKNSNIDWIVIRGNENYTHIFDLAYEVEYEYKVGTVCSDGNIVYSDTYTAILEDWKKKFEISCGKIPAFDKTNFVALKQLNPGDVFYAGDFPVTAYEAKGSNGVFSGKGWTTLPLFGFVKIAVQFTNVKINKDYQLADGYIETSYDKDEKLIADLDRIWHGGDDTGQTKTGAVESRVKANFSIPDDATANYDEGNGEIIIKDKDGNEVGRIEIPEKDKETITSGNPFDYTIEDKDGKIYTYTKDENGNTSLEKTGEKEKPLPENSFSETQIATKTGIVEFLEAENAKYTFDTWKDYYKTVSLIANKNTYEFIGSYPVACQLIPSGKSEYVAFKVNKTDKNLNEDSIIFKTKTGYRIEPKNGLLHITGGKENDAQDLYALYPDGKGAYLTLGKLKILSYPEKSCNVVLVPLNESNVNAQEVGKYLNKVYGKVGVSWNVTSDNDFSYPDLNLHSEGSGFLSAYTDEMKALNSEYRNSRGGLDKNTAYIFILNEGSIKGQSLIGDMPRGKQFGYYFAGNGEDISRTIAHELGHGMFKLRHTFDGEYGSTAQSMKGTTDNLMDYGSGTHLDKWQWDEIHDPAWLVNPFESDEDGMAPVWNNDKIYQCIEEIRLSLKTGYDVSVKSYALHSNKNQKIKLDKYEYQFITIKRMMTKETKLSLKNADLELFTEKNLYNETQYCIGILNRVITIVVNSKEDRDKLVQYFQDKRSNSFLLFVSGYNWKNEIVEFINSNENKTENNNWLDKIIGFMNKTPIGNDDEGYWGKGFINEMVTLLKPKEVTYISGHDDVGTSNHRSIGVFSLSLESSYKTRYLIPHPCYQTPICVLLSETPNTQGFNQRRNNGKTRGQDYVNQLITKCTRNDKGLIIDTVDIVCHSMGYAHALGVIDAIENAMKTELKGLSLGRFYIFAPENPGCGDVGDGWKEVWQYGSDEETLKEKPWLQDGVAPQSPAGGIGNRRAFIPDNVPQGFLESHSISNYGWVFNRKAYERGYISPRQ